MEILRNTFTLKELVEQLDILNKNKNVEKSWTKFEVIVLGEIVVIP